MVVHRLWAIDGDRLILRGDTNGYADPPLPRDAVVGRVRAVRLGALVLTEPRGDASLRLLRRLGTAWAELAPPLRRGLRRMTARIRPKAPDC